MHMRVRSKGLWVGVMMALILSGLGGARAEAAERGAELKAVFIRGGDLWIQSGDTEKQMTQGDYIRHPKWSKDGQWIAYTKGENEQELWVLHVPTGASRIVSPKGGSWANFQWAPDMNRLAFQTEQQLFWADPQQPDKHVEIAKGIGNYSWLPDGSGLLASSAAKLLPDTGWTPVSIVQIPLTAAGEPLPGKTLYVLPKPTDEFLAVGTSIFKWSADGRWIAFLATPTASLSADSNTLCILSADGATFRKLDEMVHNDQWFEWAGVGHKLAYIGGIGREAGSNKQLKVVEIPKGKPAAFIPAGYVDQGLAWQGLHHIVVSRAREAKPADDGPAIRPFPSLVDVELKKERTQSITSPSDAHGDYQPTVLPAHQLAWVRSNRQMAQVMLADTNGRHERLWIPNIDLGANYYEQWNWSAVLQIYK